MTRGDLTNKSVFTVCFYGSARIAQRSWPTPSHDSQRVFVLKSAGNYSFMYSLI